MEYPICAKTIQSFVNLFVAQTGSTVAEPQTVLVQEWYNFQGRVVLHEHDSTFVADQLSIDTHDGPAAWNH